jgi:hypothetical protein
MQHQALRHDTPAYDSGMVPEIERTYLTFCKRLEEKIEVMVHEKHHIS